MSVCRACDALLHQSARGRHRVYCDSRCKDRYKRRMGLKPRYTKLLPCSVPDCTGEGVGRSLCNMHHLRQRRGLADCQTLGCVQLSREQGYCRAHAPVAVPYARCQCGAVFVKRGVRVHCRKAKAYDPVKGRAAYRRWADAHGVGGHPTRSGECAECGGHFTTNVPSKVYCSVVCARRGGRRQARSRRRARQHAAFVEAVYRRKVYERDGWRCQLCGKAVKRDAVVPHPKAPTIDHIIPLDPRCGGTHEYRNVQTAHFLCNSVKGSGVFGGAEQLRLIA